MILATGRKLGGYTILSLLGAGAMGEVYRARDNKLRREVAVKVLPPALLRDPDSLARFMREAHLLASLNHPNIATIHALEERNGIHFLILELVDGTTLFERLTGGVMPIPDALDIAAQVAGGLAIAHQTRIVHRDMKPKNVMIRPDGIVKILDFGLGKLQPLFSREVDGSTVPAAGGATDHGTILGTVEYMSPQQAAGFSVDFRSDQFSFGTVLYEMVTGRWPFHRETVAQTLACIIEQSPL